VTSYSRQEVLRILQIGSRQLRAWEQAQLFPKLDSYSLQDLGQLRTLRLLRKEPIRADVLRRSIQAMKAVAGMEHPLLEARPLRTGSRICFRHHGAIVDPIRRQFVFDFECAETGGRVLAASVTTRFQPAGDADHSPAQDLFLEAVQAEESGKKHQAIVLYERLLGVDPDFAPAYINLGTLCFHVQEFERAEWLYRRATQIDPSYVLAFFDLGNVLDELNRPEESIAAYRRAVELSPGYADAHYNLALACERRGRWREALKHWQAYLRVDKQGPWAEHARSQIRMLLSREPLAIAWRSKSFVPPVKGMAALNLVEDAPAALEP
jgi:hypothetical protein